MRKRIKASRCYEAEAAAVAEILDLELVGPEFSGSVSYVVNDEEDLLDVLAEEAKLWM